MKKRNNIAEVSGLFHISTSALRYWDEEGLIRFERSPDNNYRYTTFQTMMDICDVLFYRDLSFSVKNIKKVPKMNLEQLQDTLIQNKKNLREQIQEMEESIQKIELKCKMIEWVKGSMDEFFTIETTTLPPVFPFSFEDKENIQMYINNPHQGVIMIDSDQSQCPEYGIFVQPEEDQIQKKGSDSRIQYLKGLLKVSSSTIREHNGDRFAEYAVKCGYTPGKITGRYLVSACEEHDIDVRRYDYYEAWMQLGEN